MARLVKLGVRADHRRSMFRNLVTSLLKHEKIETTESQDISKNDIKPEDFVIDYEGCKVWIGMTIEDIINQGYYVKADCCEITSDLDYLIEEDEVDGDDYKEDFSNMMELLSKCYVEDNDDNVCVTIYKEEDGKFDDIDRLYSEDEISVTANNLSGENSNLLDCIVTKIKVNTERFAEVLEITTIDNKSKVNYQDLVDKLGEPVEVEKSMIYFEEQMYQCIFQLSDNLYLEAIMGGNTKETTIFYLYTLHNL